MTIIFLLFNIFFFYWIELYISWHFVGGTLYKPNHFIQLCIQHSIEKSNERDIYIKNIKIFNLGASLILLVIFLLKHYPTVEAQYCRPSEKIKGIKPHPGQCNKENDTDYCVQGKFYPIFKCSPSVFRNTRATFTLNI